MIVWGRGCGEAQGRAWGRKDHRVDSVGSLEKDPQPPPWRWLSSGFRNVGDLAVAWPDLEAVGTPGAAPGLGSPARRSRRGRDPRVGLALTPSRLPRRAARVALRTDPWAGFLYVVQGTEREWGRGERLGRECDPGGGTPTRMSARWGLGWRRRWAGAGRRARGRGVAAAQSGCTAGGAPRRAEREGGRGDLRI